MNQDFCQDNRDLLKINSFDELNWKFPKLKVAKIGNCQLFFVNSTLKSPLVIYNLLFSSIIKTSKEIEAFKKSDMYSFSLVIWEILRKTRIDDTDDTSAEDFELPYYQVQL